MAQSYSRPRPHSESGKDPAASTPAGRHVWAHAYTSTATIPIVDLDAARVHRDVAHVEGIPPGPWPGDERPVDDRWNDDGAGWYKVLPDDPVDADVVLLRTWGGAS